MLHPFIMERLSPITEEERAILGGQTVIDRDLYMDGMHDIITGDKLLEPGKLITVRPHTRFIRFPKHTHDYVEMVYMCSGSTTHLVNGTQLTLGEGELLILGQNAVQEIEPAGEHDIAVNFIVRPTFFSGVLPYLGERDTPLRRFLIDCLVSGGETSYLLFRVADVLPIRNLVENLLYTLLEPTAYKREVQQVTMGLLFMQLMNHTDMLEIESTEQTAIVSVLRYIEEQYQNGSLTEIAARLHYDLHFLSRLIKESTGKTYTALVQEKRLRQAAWLLENTDRNVDEIAVSVGYENVSYFHRLFFAQYGLSPKKFRDCK